jgi:hypothetical protein
MYMNLNYTIPVIVIGQFSSRESEEMGAINDQETDNCDSESPVNRLCGKSSLMKEYKVLIIGDSHARNCAANVKTDIWYNLLCVRSGSCRGIMLRQDELAFIKAISSLQLSPAFLREVRSALASRKKKTAVAAGSRSTAHGGGPKASSQLAGKRKANELLSSGDSTEPVNRRPAPDTGSTLLTASLSVTGEQAAISSRQLGPSEGGATYAAVLAGDVTPQQPSGSLKPTAMESDPSESAVSTETANRRMSSDMSVLWVASRMAPLLPRPDL